MTNTTQHNGDSGGIKKQVFKCSELIIHATVKSLVTDLLFNNSRKLSPRFCRANDFSRSCFQHTLPISIN